MIAVGTDGWSYGAEHELADWDIRDFGRLPNDYGRDKRDITIVNSNGLANDPTGRLHPFGGEINTPPTPTPEGQVECLQKILRLLPEAEINYRSNLHIHVRIPGLKDDLRALKSLHCFIHLWMPEIFPLIEPLDRPVQALVQTDDEYKGACKRWRRCRVSHHTLLTPSRLARQLQAAEIDDFFRLEVPWSKTGPMWHLQPRLCVSIRQLLQTDTIEFRHFPGTREAGRLLTAVEWCRDFLLCWREGRSPVGHFATHFAERYFPYFSAYHHNLEVRYLRTKSGVPMAQRKAAVEEILEKSGWTI